MVQYIRSDFNLSLGIGPDILYPNYIPNWLDLEKSIILDTGQLEWLDKHREPMIVDIKADI